MQILKNFFNKHDLFHESYQKKIFVSGNKSVVVHHQNGSLLKFANLVLMPAVEPIR